MYNKPRIVLLGTVTDLTMGRCTSYNDSLGSGKHDGCGTPDDEEADRPFREAAELARKAQSEPEPEQDEKP